MTGRATAWHGPVPPVPESRLEPVVEDQAVLMWVRHGSLTVDVNDGGSLVASAGEAVWVPPGARHSARLQAESVAVPILAEIEEIPASLRQACVVNVPSTWEDWLLRRVGAWFGFSSSVQPDRSRLIDLLREVGPADVVPTVMGLPPLPRSPGARAVVDRLRRHPGSSAGLSELATDAMTSPRTLQRQLREETGRSLGQWRTAVRVDAAATHLANGRDLGWTAHHVGYASVTSFTHAFSARMGISPGRWAAHCAAAGQPPDPLVRELQTPATPSLSAPAPPDVPAVPMWSWVPPFDSVLWVHSGSACVEVAGRRWDVQAGDVLWLPRGLPHRLEIAEGSIVLPLGWKSAGHMQRPGSLHVLRMPDTPEMERFLLHTVVSNHFLLRPPRHDDRAFLDLLQPSGHAVLEAPSTYVQAVISGVMADPSDQRNLTDWAAELGTDLSSLRREFADVMGETFPRWRAKVRMTEARALMEEGLPPSAVARRLGYSHLPAFSKAFSASHGIPPREWLRREAV